MGEAAGTAMVLALAGPKGRALRGEEAVVCSAIEGCWGGRHFAGGAGRGEGCGGDGGEDEGELHCGGVVGGMKLVDGGI